ncbi:DUF6233 domain-containing protein [Streptomyces virginiae]|uniref:DUF6233 domain-containing protein n=1 Tax=Streptomyces virginiae TaxID=1961 RepID=UPI003863A501
MGPTPDVLAPFAGEATYCGGWGGRWPKPPRWWIEYGIGVSRRPDRVHTGTCQVTSRGRAATRESVLEVLRTVPSVIACPLCRPDSELGLLDT